MARIRTVKPDYPKHRKVRRVSRDARLLNIHLWNLADDEGRLQELPAWIIGEVFPTDDDVTPAVLGEWLGELEGAGLILRYEVDGERYIACHGWSEHQKINRATPSLLPPPPPPGGGVSPPDGLREESLSPHGGKGKEEEGKGKSAIEIADAPLSHLLADLVGENDPDGKRPTVTARWADAERLMVERDGRDPVVAERLIRWTQGDDFWRGNVQSMPKFREQYGRLHAQASRPRSAADKAEKAIQDGLAMARGAA